MSLFLLAVAAAAQAAAPPSTIETRYKACLALVDKNPEQAIVEAENWRVTGNGGVPARQCLGLAYAAQGRWISAATAFEQAARAAERDRDARAATLWSQAGNAALAGSDAARAQMAFDAAIAAGMLAGRDLGEAHIDRARALVLLRNTKAARADLDAGLKLVPEDPLGWLLSASLARRMGDLARAQADIAEAAKRSPDDAAVALEAGNIAALSGSPDAARTAWEAAVKLAPNRPEGRAAADALKQLGPPPAAATQAKPTP